MKDLTTEELQSRLSSGPVALFDVRGDLEFEDGHIPGAKTAPLGSLNFRVADLMRPDSFVAVYSDGPDGLAAEAADRLEHLGLHNVHCYQGGIQAWEKAGMEVIPSPDPKEHTHGPALEVRSGVVDRDRDYGGAFKGEPRGGEEAGG